MLISTPLLRALVMTACLMVAADMPVFSQSADSQPVSQTIPPSTAIPVVLTRSVAAGQSKPGDAVFAKTLQAVLLPHGRVLPSGTPLIGHVVASTPFAFDATPYAAQKPSVLSIHLDSIAIPSTIARVSSVQVAAVAGAVVPVNLALRAIAGPVASHEAETPHGLDEIDWSPARSLIGGETTSALETTVLAPDGGIAGYNRGQGVFARLIASVSADPNAGIRCNATDTEHSVGIFSADACGAYGLNSVSLMSNGSHDDGTFVLESRQRSVKLYAGSTALLEALAR